MHPCSVSTLATALLLLGFHGTLPAQETGQWVNISDSVVAQLAALEKKPGEFGPTAGVGVDRSNGDVYMVIAAQGLWKSTDHGTTFERIDQGHISGRLETGFSMDFDPAGGRLACFPVYGTAGVATDHGQTWQKSSAKHVDCIAVDWASNSLLSVRHESGGELIYNPDGAKTWKSLGKGYKGVGLFDAQTLIGIRENGRDRVDNGIYRSTDTGATFTRVSELTPIGQAVRVFKGAGYLVSAKGLLVSRDRGATWSLLGSEVPSIVGPYFGKDETAIVVGTKTGLYETRDAGKTWTLAAPLPPGFDGNYMCNYGWDYQNDIFYVSRMTKPTFRFQR